jgi:hypothetical protein
LRLGFNLCIANMLHKNNETKKLKYEMVRNEVLSAYHKAAASAAAAAAPEAHWLMPTACMHSFASEPQTGR